MPLRWFRDGEEIEGPQPQSVLPGPATGDLHFPGGTAAELLRTIDPEGVHTVRTEWREPTSEEIAEYRRESRDYAKRRREGRLWHEEEPPSRPTGRWVNVFYRTGPPLPGIFEGTE